jgi:tRNA A-37 threonylcarbamoyl transferase component Bud32
MAFFCIHCKSEIDPKFKACPFCGEPITDFLRRHLESPIDGKYKILARLGIGGMGEVYKVLHVHLNAIRVIKLMRSAIASDEGAHERFLREARLATKINHPNVATLFDFSTLEDGTHYMVWEYIEGTNLHELIDERGPLSPRYAGRLAVQALHGLDAIHRAGIVHRDVSPENLMIARDDEGIERVKIIDLGIAKSSAADDNKTKTGMFVGKWKYCSPEHLGMLPSGERIDGRADLYSFGIVLYEMLAGVPPFQADTPHAYLMMHSQQQPKKLAELNPHAAVCPELEAIIFRSLEKDRAKRFATAREFANAIEAVADRLSDTAGAPPPLPAAAEITDEATRVVPRGGEQDASTLVTREIEVEPAEPTVVTAGIPEPLAEVAAPPARKAPLAAVAAMFVAAVGAIAWYAMRDPAPVAATPRPVQARSLPAKPAAGRLGINAFPWANVTSIRNVDTGTTVAIADPLVTPAPVDLPAGTYEVTLANPRFSKPITRTVSVAAGGDALLSVQFADPDALALPDFGGGR